MSTSVAAPASPADEVRPDSWFRVVGGDQPIDLVAADRADPNHAGGHPTVA